MRQSKFCCAARPWLVIAFATFLLVRICGCSGVETGLKVPPSVSAGVFLDGPVAGLHYATPTIEGVTGADGVFEYRTGEIVTFSIGRFVLGSTSGKPVVTPLDMVSGAKEPSEQRVVNICVILQTLDADGDPENGIQISETVASMVSRYARDININKPARLFSFDGGFRSVMAELNYIDAFGDLPRGVKPPNAAQKHLEATLKKIQEKK